MVKAHSSGPVISRCGMFRSDSGIEVMPEQPRMSNMRSDGSVASGVRSLTFVEPFRARDTSLLRAPSGLRSVISGHRHRYNIDRFESFPMASRFDRPVQSLRFREGSLVKADSGVKLVILGHSRKPR